MPRGMGGKSPANIVNYLEGIDFPATKDDLISYAEDNNAPEEVIDVLENIPDQEFTSLADLMQGVSQAE